MADSSQGAVVEFLTAEGSNPKEIFRRLRSVFGEGAVDVSSKTGPVVSRAVKRALVTGCHIGVMPCSASAESFRRSAESVLSKGGKIY
jgi:hypothetical protein